MIDATCSLPKSNPRYISENNSSTSFELSIYSQTHDNNFYKFVIKDNDNELISRVIYLMNIDVYDNPNPVGIIYIDDSIEIDTNKNLKNKNCDFQLRVTNDLTSYDGKNTVRAFISDQNKCGSYDSSTNDSYCETGTMYNGSCWSCPDGSESINGQCSYTCSSSTSQWKYVCDSDSYTYNPSMILNNNSVGFNKTYNNICLRFDNTGTLEYECLDNITYGLIWQGGTGTTNAMCGSDEKKFVYCDFNENNSFESNELIFEDEEHIMLDPFVGIWDDHSDNDSCTIENQKKEIKCRAYCYKDATYKEVVSSVSGTCYKDATYEGVPVGGSTTHYYRYTVGLFVK